MRREHTMRIVQPSRRYTPGWQPTQNAAIAALSDTEEALVHIGVHADDARAFTRAAVCAFLERMASRAGATPLQSVYEVVEDFLAIAQANPYKKGRP